MNNRYLLSYRSARANQKMRIAKNIPFSRRMKNRGKNGSMIADIRDRFASCKKEPSKSNFQALLISVLYYFLGSRLTNRILKKSTEEVLKESLYVPAEGEFLYHWTSSDCVERIKKTGLVAGKKNHVFLTDDPDFLIGAGYFDRKVCQEKRDLLFVLLKIDAPRLHQDHEIYKIRKSHEYYVDAVPLHCILFE